MANYPTSASTDANLYVTVNNLRTLLNGAINNSITTITVDSTTGFPTSGLFSVENEVIAYTGKNATQFTGCTRGFDGTTADSHVDDSFASLRVVAAHHNKPKDEIIAIENDLVAALASITPVAGGNTATSILNRLAQIVFQIKAGFTLTNWYDTITPINSIPTGAMVDFAGTSTPAGGWLLCDGSVVAQATYPALFTAIGSTWNTGGEGGGNFRLPDSRRRTTVGSGGSGTGTLGNATGNTGGAETHTLTTAELAVHNHGVTDPGHFHAINQALGASGSGGNAILTTAGGFSVNTASKVTGVTVNNAGSGSAHNNLQPSMVVTKIIKT